MKWCRFTRKAKHVLTCLPWLTPISPTWHDVSCQVCCLRWAHLCRAPSRLELCPSMWEGKDSQGLQPWPAKVDVPLLLEWCWFSPARISSPKHILFFIHRFGKLFEARSDSHCYSLLSICSLMIFMPLLRLANEHVIGLRNLHFKCWILLTFISL